MTLSQERLQAMQQALIDLTAIGLWAFTFGVLALIALRWYFFKRP